MRTRLEPKAPPVYHTVRDNFFWADHAARTLVTAGLIAWLAPETIVDPACGDASILESAFRLRPFKFAVVGDISKPQMDALVVSFPNARLIADYTVTLARARGLDKDLGPGPKMDCVVLTEFLEHLEDPEAALRQAREVGEALVASVPIGDPELGRNHEHLWSWDEEGFEEMLVEAGWTPIVHTTVILPGVAGNSQIWVAR